MRQKPLFSGPHANCRNPGELIGMGRQSNPCYSLSTRRWLVRLPVTRKLLPILTTTFPTITRILRVFLDSLEFLFSSLFFCKSDYGNLIGKQELVVGNRIVHEGRRCRNDARIAPRSFMPVTALTSPPFLREDRSEFSQLREQLVGCLLYEKRRVKLVVPVAVSPVSMFFHPSLRYLDEPTHSALHSSRIHFEEHANDFIIMSASRGPTVWFVHSYRLVCSPIRSHPIYLVLLWKSLNL
ncbi:hypothetical protein ALC53_02306 [Atta colombica]|uniref:Uncharacterized protein n=1 Tax=Atta colombica TaxID=520822 RepID=A0A195BS99_9HYME|nr:hypothetical protein ALC53_02306 [Atta colombica]